MKIVNNAETASLSGCHNKIRVQRNLNKVRQLQLTSVILFGNGLTWKNVFKLLFYFHWNFIDYNVNACIYTANISTLEQRCFKVVDQR